MTHVVVENIIVFVPTLAPTPRLIEMAVAVWVHDIARSEKARQRTNDRGVVENPLNIGNPGE